MIDYSKFHPLYRDAWGPMELKVALAIGVLHRMPERFKREDVFAAARRSLAPYMKAEPIPNSTEFPIAFLCFNGDEIAPRKELSALLLEQNLAGKGVIYFNSDFDCLIAFENRADMDNFIRVAPVGI